MRKQLCLIFGFAALGWAQWDDSLLKPFVMNHRAGGESPADVSFLLDAPAGKDGFAKVSGGHLVKGNGQRLRLWGVHITDWSRGSILLPPKEDIPMWAGTLARYGVNCVRLHFMDLASPRGIIVNSPTTSRTFDPDQLDRFDFLISELKKRGIYLDLNLNVGRSYKSEDGVKDFDKIQWGKGLTLYDPKIIELEKEYAKSLLTHVNPYTKIEYRNEPAIAIVEILNENGMYMGFRAPTPYYDAELTDIYNAWLSKKLSAADLAKLRTQAGVEADAKVPRLSGRDTATASPERYRTELDFYRDVETGFYTDMSAYLRQLGVRVPITGTADHSHTSSPYTMLMSLAKLDIMDGHVYWEHPGARGPVNTPMVNDPLHSTLVQLSRTAFAGKPYTVSEFNHPFPNDWAAEGIPILASYAAFQDWDAVILYTFEPKKAADWQPYVGDPFDISLDPVRMTEMATGSLLFLRGDVKPAATTVERTYSKDQTYESRKLGPPEQPYFTPGFPLALPLVHGTRIKSLEGAPTAKFDAVPAGPIVSDTKELTWDAADDHGVVMVDTPRTQALIGFLKANPKKARNLSADIANNFASLMLSSMDAKPLAQSGKMLLTAGSRVSNSGTKWNDQHTRVTQQGGTPSMIEPVSGTVTLRGLEGAASVTATAIDGAGHALGTPAAGKKTADGWTVAIGEPVTTWYVIEVKRR